MSHQKFESCIAACSACVVECLHCETECLNQQDVKALTRCIKLNRDCAAICFLAMGAMASGSEFAAKICKLCEEICIACAVECEKHLHLGHCKKCADACRKCAAECSNINKVGQLEHN